MLKHCLEKLLPERAGRGHSSCLAADSWPHLLWLWRSVMFSILRPRDQWTLHCPPCRHRTWSVSSSRSGWGYLSEGCHYYFYHLSMGLQIIPNIIWRKITIIWQCKFSLSLNSNFESGFMNNWGRSCHVEALLWESVQSLGGGDAPVIMVTSKVSHAWWWPDSPDIFSIKVWGLLWWRRIWWIFIPNGANVSSLS